MREHAAQEERYRRSMRDQHDGLVLVAGGDLVPGIPHPQLHIATRFSFRHSVTEITRVPIVDGRRITLFGPVVGESLKNAEFNLSQPDVFFQRQLQICIDDCCGLKRASYQARINRVNR